MSNEAAAHAISLTYRRRLGGILSPAPQFGLIATVPKD
jgi:hypothetical protein